MNKTTTRIAAAFAATALTITGASAAMAIEPNPQVMTISGNPALGQKMTITFAENYEIVGTYFDIWMCQDQTVIPNDNEVENGTCVPLTFWERGLVAGYSQQTTARTMSWVLQNTPTPALNPLSSDAPYLNDANEELPILPPDSENGWCDYAGWYLNVNDYSGGGNSNWSAAFSAEGCGDEPTPAPAPAPEPELANTGIDATTATTLGVFGALSVLSGVAVILFRRLKAQN